MNTKKLATTMGSLLLVTLMLTTMALAVDIDTNDGSPGRNVVSWKNVFEFDQSSENIILEYQPKYTAKYYDGRNDVMDWVLSSSEKSPTLSEVSSSVYILKIPRDIGFLNRSITLNDLFYFDDDNDYEDDFLDEDSSSMREWSYYSYLDYSLASDYDAYRNYCFDASNVGQSNSQIELEEIAAQCISTFNASTAWQEKIIELTLEKSDAQKSSEIYLDENKDLRADLEDCSNESTNLMNDRDAQKRASDSCTADLARLKGTQTSCTQTQKDLDDCNKNKTSSMLLAFLAGIAVYHFVIRKKSSGGPSEQTETGSSFDSPAYRQPASNQPTEGPRE